VLFYPLTKVVAFGGVSGTIAYEVGSGFENITIRVGASESFLRSCSTVAGRERERDQLVCFVTRGHRHSQRGSWQERERERKERTRGEPCFTHQREAKKCTSEWKERQTNPHNVVN